MVPYEEIAADLRRQIASGDLAPGDQLPSLRALVRSYGVAEGTIQSALRVLRGEGLIETYQGRGSFVIKTPAEPESSAEFLRVMQELSKLAARVDALEARAEEADRDDTSP